MKLWDNVIIGAGIAGLVLAQRLKNKGAQVLVIEKSKSVGGRMATRRDEEATFDHGAQFISSQIENIFDSQLLHPWIKFQDDQKFSVKGGINKAAKFLAQDQNILLNEKVVGLKHQNAITSVILESGATIIAQKVFITCPLPQALNLLQAGNISYPLDLEEIIYDKALVGLFRIESSAQAICNLSYEENPGSGILSVSNQQSKLVSSQFALTVVMAPRFSEAYFEKEDSGTLFLIENCLISYLSHKLSLTELELTILRSQLKKWRYSLPRKVYRKPFVQLENNGIVLLGDGFSGGALELAANSAMQVPI